MSNRSASLITSRTIDAARFAQQEQPALLAAAMKRCQTFATDHQNADEVAALAATIVAAFLPPKFRLGYGPTYAAAAPEGREVFTLTATAARTACQRAAAAVAQDFRDAAILDALTAEDPDALERIEDHGGARLTLSRYAPDPQTPYGTTDADRIAAALVAVQPEHRAALVAALDAWHPKARSLAAAVAMAHGWAHEDKERRTFANHLARALADLAPLAAPILTNPHGRTTEQTDARTPSRPAARRSTTTTGTSSHRTPATTSATYRPTTAPAWTPEEEDALGQHAGTCSHYTGRDLPWQDFRPSAASAHPCTRQAGHSGRHIDGRTLAGRSPFTDQPATRYTLPAEDRPTAWTAAATGRAGRALDRTAALATTRSSTPERWTPEEDDRAARAWTPRPRTAETTMRDLVAALVLTRTAAAQVSRPGALAAGTYQPGATDPSTASHVIVRTADAVEVRDATDGHVIARRPLEDYAALLAATRQPAALAPRHREALVPGLPDQARAERNAAQPAPGPVAKPSSRKRATTGSTGPTVPAWR